jgi:site-specific DNA-adenine methylase
MVYIPEVTVCPGCGGQHDRRLCEGWSCDCCTAIEAAPRLLPFFTFYGGKFRAARHYPGPAYRTIIEPFAGSAGYSINHPAADVWLNDIDPVITGTWSYLIGVSEQEILNLPDLEPGQTTGDLSLPQEARWLIGWWLNKGSAQPKLRPSSFMLNYPAGAPYWGESIRERIARQLPAIRHWKVTTGSYENLPDDEACWYVDPPYAAGGQHYRFGRENVDYQALAGWVRGRRGQVIACEADSADWLPFAPLTEIDGSEGRQKRNRAKMEVIYVTEPAHQD